MAKQYKQNRPCADQMEKITCYCAAVKRVCFTEAGQRCRDSNQSTAKQTYCMKQTTAQEVHTRFKSGSKLLFLPLLLVPAASKYKPSSEVWSAAVTVL